MFCVGDSQLIIRQVQGIYKVKNEGMKKLHSDTKKLLEQIPCHSLEYIPRAQNARADELSNFAMDLRQNVSVLRPAEVSSPDTQAVSVLTAVPLPSTKVDSGIETSTLDASQSHPLSVALISTDSSSSSSSSGENTIPAEETVQKEKAPKRERKSKLQIEIRDIAVSDVVCDTSIISQSVSESDGTEAVVERIEGVQDGPIVKIKRKVSPKKSSATQEAVMKPCSAISEKKVKDKQMSTKEKVVKPKKLTAVKEKDTESSLKSRKEISSSDKEVEAELKEPRKRKIKMSS